MSLDPNEQLSKIREQLRDCKRQLKAQRALNERLRAAVGYEELEGWKPDPKIETQYGWVFAWLYPLHSYLNQNLNRPLIPEIRNGISAVCTAIIAQLAVNGKYGIRLPFDPRPVDIATFSEKQTRKIDQDYAPCMICGEDRITHDCHIIPHSEGGPTHCDNYVTLCPLHHHLFDHHRLYPDEWATLMTVIATKMEAAIVYAREVHTPQLEHFWKYTHTPSASEHDR